MKKTVMMASLLVLILVALAFSLAVAAPDTQTDDWPPRPPTATPPSTETPTQVKIEGGFIELQLTPPGANWWTQVQWRDGEGAWHDVDGWRGTPTVNGIVLWYVGPEHLGESPFRWQILSEGGTIVATSDSFSLPEEAGEIIFVNIVLTDEQAASADED